MLEVGAMECAVIDLVDSVISQLRQPFVDQLSDVTFGTVIALGYRRLIQGKAGRERGDNRNLRRSGWMTGCPARRDT